VSSDKLAFVSFDPTGDGFRASLSVEGLISMDREPVETLRRASEIYERSVAKMRGLVGEIKSVRTGPRPVPARKVWELGNEIFQLTSGLERLSVQLDGVYKHLVRDLDVKKKWLEKVVILRRYLPHRRAIPKSLCWGRCEKGTRRTAEKLHHEFLHG